MTVGEMAVEKVLAIIFPVVVSSESMPCVLFSFVSNGDCCKTIGKVGGDVG